MNKEMILDGTFIGISSCGFVHGKQYTVLISFNDYKKQHILKAFSGEWCPYSSWNKILENWIFDKKQNL